jgi:hypothetical protein
MRDTLSLPENLVLHLFEPDVLTPEQHADRVQTEASDRPAIRLMTAILADAITTYQRHVGAVARREKRDFDDANRWLRSNDRSWPFSFENIYGALGFEPDVLRRGLERWRLRRLPGHRVDRPLRRVNGRRHSVQHVHRGAA